MVNTKGETSMLYVQAIVVQVEWRRQMGSVCKHCVTQVTSVVQIYLHQLMKCSRAANGDIGKISVTLGNFRGASPLTSTCEQYQSGQMSDVVNIVILVYLRGFESYLRRHIKSSSANQSIARMICYFERDSSAKLIKLSFIA